MPHGQSSIHPPFLQVGQPLPPQKGQLISNSKPGSTNGKKPGRSLTSTSLFKTLEKLLRSIKIEIEQLTLVVACEDASQTALIYAATTQTLNCSLEYLDSVSTVEVAKDAQITISPDFVSRKTKFSGKVNIYIGVLFFLYWYLILLNLKYD